MRPDFRHVENVPPLLLGVGWIHDLHVDVPLGIISPLNSLKHVPDHVIGILACDSSRLLCGEVFDSLLGLDVNLDVLERAILGQISDEREAFTL